jgi:hypothetical protein
LHVYELDPLPEENKFDGCRSSFAADTPKNDANASAPTSSGDELKEVENVKSEDVDTADEDDSSDEGKDNKPGQQYSFLAISQRRSDQISKDLLHPFVHRVFGTPLLLRVVDLEGLTGRDMYDLVASRLRNFVPKSALKFLVDMPDGPRVQEKEATESNEEIEPIDKQASESKKEERPRIGSRRRLRTTTTDMEDVAAGPVPRYGFRMRITSRDGRRCALCSWYECCIGCLVPDDDYPTVVMCGDSVVIDWHLAVDAATSGFGERAKQVEQVSPQASPFRSRLPGVTIKNHSSCGNGAKKMGYAGAITLEDCLDQFAKEENIPEVRQKTRRAAL